MSQSTATFQESILACIEASQALDKALTAAIPAMKEDDAALVMEALQNWRTAFLRLGGDAETAVADRIRREGAARAVERQDTARNVCTCPVECDCAELEIGGFVSEYCVIHNRNPIPWPECKASPHAFYVARSAEAKEPDHA